jgi:ribosomal protein L18
MGPQGQSELTRLSQNAKYEKERNRQVAEFSKKLIYCQLITNFIKKSNS